MSGCQLHVFTVAFARPTYTPAWWVLSKRLLSEHPFRLAVSIFPSHCPLPYTLLEADTMVAPACTYRGTPVGNAFVPINVKRPSRLPAEAPRPNTSRLCAFAHFVLSDLGPSLLIQESDVALRQWGKIQNEG